MPVVKSKPKLKGKPGRSAGSVVAKGLATKSTKTAKKKSSPPSVDSGYSLYSTDSEDPVTAANRGLDRCAALLANILESDDSERIASKSWQTQKKTKTGTKLKEKTGTKKSSAGTSENKLKSKPKHHTFTVPTATEDVDVSLSESPLGSNRVPINLDTDSHPMLPFKPDTDIHSGSTEAPYNERLPSSTPISTPPTLIQTEKEKQQLRERLQQGNLPVNHSKSLQDQSSKFVSHLEQNFSQQYNNGYQTLESQILRDYQNQMPVNPIQPGLRDDTSANTGTRNLYVNRWLQTDPRGHQPNAVVSSNGIYQPAAMESLLTTQPSLNQWHYHHNPNYGAILPEKEGAVNVSPNQYYPPTGGIPNYFQYGRDTAIPRTMPQQPVHYQLAGNDNYARIPSVNMNRYGNPEGMHHYGIRNEQVSVHPPSVNEGTAVQRPDVGRQTTEGAFGSDSQGSNDGSHRPSSATSTAWTTTTNPSSHVMQTVSGGPRSSSACGSQLTIDTSYQPDNDIAKPISPFRPSTSYTSSRSNSLVHNISTCQSDAESKSHESKSSNEKAGANRTPVKTPPTHTENQSHKRKSNPVHTVKYLLRELRALNSMHGDIEVNRLLDEIDYTMNAVPDVKATYNMETEIGLALQPLRSENAQLRRKLRIVNQQIKDKEKVKTEPKEGTVSYDLLAAETMNATLQRQLDDDKKHRDKLLKRIEELKGKLQIVQDERKKMLYLMDEKDSDHLKSREEWTLESSKMKVQAEQATAKAETLQIKLEASVKEKDILQLTLKQRDAEIERLKDLNGSLQLSVSNLVQDLETSKPSLSNRDDQYTVPPVSLHRLESLLNPDLISQRENNSVADYFKRKAERSEVRDKSNVDSQGERSEFKNIPKTDFRRKEDFCMDGFTPVQNDGGGYLDERKSPAQRSLNFGRSVDERRLKSNLGSRFVSEDDDLAKTLTDIDSFDYEDSYQKNGHNCDSHRKESYRQRSSQGHQRSSQGHQRSTLTKENLEEHNKTFLDDNKEEYRLNMLSRGDEDVLAGDPSTPVIDKYGSTLSSGTLTPSHGGGIPMASQASTQTPSQDGTLTPRNSRETSPSKGEPKMVTFSTNGHEEYYYDPKSKIHNSSKSTLTEKPSFEYVENDYNADYRSKSQSNSLLCKNGNLDDFPGVQMQEDYSKPEFDKLHMPDSYNQFERKRGFGDGKSGFEKSGFDDIVSVTSGSTMSSVTSHDERQFRQGLANLDADIARLQSNLKQLKN